MIPYFKRFSLEAAVTCQAERVLQDSFTQIVPNSVLNMGAYRTLEIEGKMSLI